VFFEKLFVKDHLGHHLKKKKKERDKEKEKIAIIINLGVSK